MTARLNAARPITRPDGTMEQAFRDEMARLSALTPFVGTGSPEGVLAAPQFSLYIDEAGAPGAVEYRKLLTDVAGDATQGWVAV